MERHRCEPRPGWQSTIEEQGLVYWRTDRPDGSQVSYWNEAAHYSFDSAEVFEMEASVRVLMDMLVEAGDHIIEANLFHRMGIPGWAVPQIRATWEAEPPMIYGRFDFAYAGDGLIKLLEYNADTPTALLETAIQWHWVQDVFGSAGDQWNGVHEALVARWRSLLGTGRLPGETIHLLHTSQERSGEDFMTAGYLAATAHEAGLRCDLLAIEQVGWHPEVGFIDTSNRPIRCAFKLYPWEWMVREEYAKHAVEHMGTGPGQTTWIEPIWKMLWSNKGILPVLWELFGGHEMLLPAWFDGEQPADLREFVRKPLFAREGANTEIVLDGAVAARGPDQGYGEEGFVVQQYVDLGDYGDGARPVLGIWTVDMEPVGCGIREQDGLITDNTSRFVPHVIAA